MNISCKRRSLDDSGLLLLIVSEPLCMQGDGDVPLILTSSRYVDLHFGDHRTVGSIFFRAMLGH